MKKIRYIIMPLVMGVILLITPFIFKVNATVERNVINIQTASNVFGIFRVNYITLQDDPDVNYPLFRFSYTYDNNNVVVDINQKLDSATGKIILSSASGSTAAQNVDTIYSFWIRQTGTYLAIKIFKVYYDYSDEIFKLTSQLIYENIERNSDITNLSISTFSLFYGSSIYGGNYDYTNQQVLDIINDSINYDFLAYDSITAYNQGYDDGDTAGFNRGYIAGQNGETAVTPFFAYLRGTWNVVDDVLSLEIIPHIKLWYFIGVPLFFLVLWGVLKIWKHN